jgi:hypothetical protein
LDWVTEHLGLPHISLPTFSSSAASYAVVAGLLAAVAVVTVRAVRHGFFGRLRHARAPGVVVTDAGESLGPAQWRERADRLAAEGRYREALRCRYCALIAELAQRSLVEEVPGRTSGDYQRLVSSALPDGAAAFAAATELFENCWYGDEPSGPQDQARFEGAAQLVMTAVDAGRWQLAS